MGTAQMGGALIIKDSVLPDNDLDITSVLLECRKGAKMERNTFWSSCDET